MKSYSCKLFIIIHQLEHLIEALTLCLKVGKITAITMEQRKFWGKCKFANKSTDIIVLLYILVPSLLVTISQHPKPNYKWLQKKFARVSFNVILQSEFETSIPSLVAQTANLLFSLTSSAHHTLLFFLR